MYCITIDSGTTNTRAKVWLGDRIIAESFVEAGVRDTSITGSKEKLQEGLKTVIDKAITRAQIKSNDIKAIIASGMITSNVGLYEVPHIIAPVGIKELAASMVQAEVPEVCNMPIWFIPGVKNNSTSISVDNCDVMDMMRGEETEVVGITEKLNITGPALLVLPGSHTKIVSIDKECRITDCVTTLAGELLEIITNKTILADALQNSFVEDINESMVLRGAEASLKLGLGRTCFSVRILDLFSNLTVNDKANYLLGAVLGSDILAIKNSKSLMVHSQSPIVIMGKKSLKEALAVLIRNDKFFRGELQVVPDELNKNIAGFGALAIAKEGGLLS